MSYDHGDIVIDKEAENPEEAVVIRKTDRRISKWTINEEGTTVLDNNPGYDEEELTTLVVFKHYLDDEWPEWTEEDPDNLYHKVMDKEHISWYSFPKSRLVKKEEGQQDEAV